MPNLLRQHRIRSQPFWEIAGRVSLLKTWYYSYLIFYEPTDDELIIHGIRHSARDPSFAPYSD
jgi:hypothetical protein